MELRGRWTFAASLSHGLQQLHQHTPWSVFVLMLALVRLITLQTPRSSRTCPPPIGRPKNLSKNSLPREERRRNASLSPGPLFHSSHNLFRNLIIKKSKQSYWLLDIIFNTWNHMDSHGTLEKVKVNPGNMGTPGCLTGIVAVMVSCPATARWSEPTSEYWRVGDTSGEIGWAGGEISTSVWGTQEECGDLFEAESGIGIISSPRPFWRFRFMRAVVMFPSRRSPHLNMHIYDIGWVMNAQRVN